MLSKFFLIDERIKSNASIEIGVWANTIAHIPNGSSPSVASNAAGHSFSGNVVSIPLVTTSELEEPRNSWTMGAEPSAEHYIHERLSTAKGCMHCIINHSPIPMAKGK